MGIKTKQYLTIGILGGMGPESTADLFSNIIALTPATSDKEHIPMYINNVPSIPDRSAFILKRGPDPTPALIENAQKLESWGADFIIMPCNTAHYFADRIKESIRIPLVDMIEETALHAKKLKLKSFGLLSTLGTYKTNIYQNAFSQESLDIMIPDIRYRDLIMKVIYGRKGLKAGYREEVKEDLLKCLKNLKQQNIQGVVAGCTELALILDDLVKDIPVLNPTRILAKAAVEFAGRVDFE